MTEQHDWPGPCRECRSFNVVVGDTGGGLDGMEAKCRDCGSWFDPSAHPAGCFYGSFLGAYGDAWHVPAGRECDLPHGEDAIHLESADEGRGE